MVMANDFLCYFYIVVEDSFEYLWNMTVNLKGGIYNNIPNDNCVELQVNNIKRELTLRVLINHINQPKTFV